MAKGYKAKCTKDMPNANLYTYSISLIGSRATYFCVPIWIASNAGVSYSNAGTI